MTIVPGNPARRLAALALTAVLAAGCGDDSTPAEAAPELAEQLASVDRAVAAGKEPMIRQRVESLVAATEAARDSGRLDEEQADRILAAADALLARLPAEKPTPKPTPSPPTSSATTATPDPDEGDEDEEGEGDEGDKSDHGKGKGKGKGHKGKKG
jgi:hypothetical protein